MQSLRALAPGFSIYSSVSGLTSVSVMLNGTLSSYTLPCFGATMFIFGAVLSTRTGISRETSVCSLSRTVNAYVIVFPSYGAIFTVNTHVSLFPGVHVFVVLVFPARNEMFMSASSLYSMVNVPFAYLFDEGAVSLMTGFLLSTKNDVFAQIFLSR